MINQHSTGGKELYGRKETDLTLICKCIHVSLSIYDWNKNSYLTLIYTCKSLIIYHNDEKL